MKFIYPKFIPLLCFLAFTATAQVNTNSWPGVFNPFSITTLHFEVNTNDWENIKRDTNYYDPVLNIRVPCLMWEQGSTNKMTVQIRRKSDPALPNESNPQKVSLKIDINEYVPGQKWRSLEKLSLENGSGNGVLREGVAMNLHRLASEGGFYDYDAGFATWVRVVVNGNFVGLYSSPEQRDKRFLQHRGMYKPGASWLYEINGGITLDTSVNTTNSPTHSYLCFDPFARQNPCAQPNLETALPQWIDMKSMLTFAAVEAFVGNGDGLFTHTGKNSFAVDFLPSTQRKRLYFPWDLDAGFSNASFDIYAGGPGQTSSRKYQTQILNHYWFRHVYRHTMTDLLDGPLSTASLTAFLNQLEPVLGPAIAEDPNASDSISSLRSFITNRVANVRGQVGTITGWPRFNQQGGEIISGFGLTLSHTNSSGTIYYTFNGVDPRAVGGSASGTAYTGPITLTNTTHVMARVLSGTNWSALREGTFNIAGHASGIRITEIMYNPLPTGTNDDAGQHEFIEMKNTGSTPANLSKCYFDGIEFTFAPNTIIAPGAFVVLVRNPASFAARYPGISFHGVYFDGLSAEGEKIRLKNSDGNNIFSVSFSNKSPWPIGANGLGYSIVNNNPAGDPDNSENWRSSTNIHGSPGADDPAPSYGVGVIVNEVIAHTDSPLEDAIELYNTSFSSIDISGWYLSDSLNEADPARASLKKYKIPSGTIIPARGYKVFYENAFNPGSPNANALTPFGISKSGEGAYLSSAGSGGNLTGHIVGFEFGAQDNGVSYGRYQTSVGPDLTFFAQHTFGVSNPTSRSNFRTGTGATNSQPLIGPVVINEIMYNPTNGGNEFIELFNLSGTNINLGGWVMNGAGYTFATNTVISSNGFLLLVGTTNITAAQFRSANNVPAAVPILMHKFNLQNDGEKLELLKINDDPLEPVILVDRVRYNDNAPWPTEADGFGPSLERTAPNRYGNDPANWRTPRNGGSPGNATTTNEVIVFQRNSRWEAQDSGWNLGSAWRELGYSSSGWLPGNGVIGYNDSSVRTILTNAATKRPVTTYFRKEFVINESPSVWSSPPLLTFGFKYNDGFVAYFNGQEVLRRSMPNGAITASTLANGTNSGTYESVTLPSTAWNNLVRGKNVIAVELHQASTNDSTAFWDASLTYAFSSLPNEDTDSDGMPDWWEDANGFNKFSSSDASLDADGDGMSNLAEFLAGTNPRDANSRLHIISVQTTPANLTILWSSVTGKSYVVQSSTNLTSWSNASSPIQAVSSETEFTSNGGPGNKFYRITLQP